jgi:hypothetical protein
MVFIERCRTFAISDSGRRDEASFEKPEPPGSCFRRPPRATNIVAQRQIRT